MDGGWFDDWDEGFIEVHARLLGETTNNLAGFVASEDPIRVVFVAKDPLAADNVGTWGRGTRVQVPTL